MGKAMLTMIRSRANAKGMIEAGLLVPNGDILRGKKGKESRICNVSTTTSRCARLSHVSATVGRYCCAHLENIKQFCLLHDNNLLKEINEYVSFRIVDWQFIGKIHFIL